MAKNKGGIYQEWYDKNGRKRTRRLDADGITETVENSCQKDSRQNGSSDHWYKKPVGIIVLSVTGGLILILIGAALRHLFPSLFSN